jgi:superfamily II DNA or RNA helicase
VTIETRGYETQAVTEIRAALKTHQRVVAVGPTGCGKTVIASMVVQQAKRLRVLFVAHKHELIDQAHAQLAALGIDAGVIMAQDERLHGEGRVNPDARVQVASVQTVARRGGPARVDLIVFDEAHRVMADSYQRIADAYPDAMILGLTATPLRMDGKGLGEFFRAMVTIATPSDLYAAGYLARPRVYVAPDGVLAELRKRVKGAAVGNGDYTGKALARIVDSTALVGSVVSEAIRLAPKVPKVVFAGSVKHSQALCARFKRHGITAAHLDGETDPHERVRILDDLRAGRVEVVCNVGVLTEGWDLPSLGAVIIARPTRSLTLLFQMAGRVQRPHKGRVPVVIDHGNCCIALGVDPREDYPWSLDMASGKREGAPVVKSCGDCLAVIPGGCTECPACGAVQPRTAQQEREEVEAKLVELGKARVAGLRSRLEDVARSKNAHAGWVDEVMSRATA